MLKKDSPRGLGATATSGATAATPRRGRPRSEKAHRAILDATLELLAETGVMGLSIDAVAVRAGVGKRTIYRRWPSKLPLVLDAIATLPEIRIPATATFRRSLVRMAHYFERVLRGSPLGGVMLNVVTGGGVDPELDAAIGRYLTERRAPLVELMRRGIARGEIGPGTDPEACADVFAGAILNRLFFSRRRLDKRFIDHVISTVMTGGTPRRRARGNSHRGKAGRSTAAVT